MICRNFDNNLVEGTVRNLNIVQFPHMTYGIGGSHTFCVHGDDVFHHVLGGCVLIFFDYLRLEFPSTVMWDIQFHIAIADIHRFLGITIAAVVRFFVTMVIPGVIQFLIHLFIEGAFQDTDIMFRMMESTSVPSLIFTSISFRCVLIISLNAAFCGESFLTPK